MKLSKPVVARIVTHQSAPLGGGKFEVDPFVDDMRNVESDYLAAAHF